MITVTLDTNSIINLLDTSSQTPTSVDELMEIMRLAMVGTVNIAVTTRAEYDLSKDKNNERKEKMLRQINMFPMIASGFRLDMSKLGSTDFLSDPNHQKLTQEVKDILFPSLSDSDRRYTNKLADIDHLVSHIYSKRSVFVTDDGEFLKKATILKDKFGVYVLSPKQALEKISLSQSPLHHVSLFREKWEEYIKYVTKFLSEGGTLTSADDKRYREYHDWFKRNFPKIKGKLSSFRLEMNSQNYGGGKFIIDDDVLSELQHDVNPFEIFYAGSDLSTALESIDTMFRAARPYEKPLDKWAIDEMEAARDILIEFEGSLE